MERNIIYKQYGKDPLYKIWHSQGNHMFMYIHSGTGSIVSEEKMFPLKEGLLLLVTANKYHYTLPDDTTAYIRSKMIFSPEIFENNNTLFDENLSNSIICAQIPVEKRREVELIFEEYANHKNDDTNELLFFSCIFKLAFFMKEYFLESITTLSGTLNTAIKYINQNISNNITIDDICKTVNLSKYHFCRQFKGIMGLTVMKYILRTRITLAKSDLTKTDLSISEISEKCGFSSVSYFCRIFKETENCSPLQFRKNVL